MVAAQNVTRVWVRSLGQNCRIRVESVQNALWLLDRLTQLHALVGLDGIDITPTESGCKFQIPSSTERTLGTLEAALRRIPGVRLMLEPESI